jgi:hypothetical protein
MPNPSVTRDLKAGVLLCHLHHASDIVDLATNAVTALACADSTLSVSASVGAVNVSLNLAHANTWTAAQTFQAQNSGLCPLTIIGASSMGVAQDYFAIRNSALNKLTAFSVDGTWLIPDSGNFVGERLLTYRATTNEAGNAVLSIERPGNSAFNLGAILRLTQNISVFEMAWENRTGVQNWSTLTMRRQGIAFYTSPPEGGNNYFNENVFVTDVAVLRIPDQGYYPNGSSALKYAFYIAQPRQGSGPSVTTTDFASACIEGPTTFNHNGGFSAITNGHAILALTQLPTNSAVTARGFAGQSAAIVRIQIAGGTDATTFDKDGKFGVFAGFADGVNMAVGTSSGTIIATAVNQKLGFFAKTPVVQQTDGTALTNNVTSGGTNDVIADFTDLSTYANDAATIRNNIYQLARKQKINNDALRAYGLLS